MTALLASSWAAAGDPVVVVVIRLLVSSDARGERHSIDAQEQTEVRELPAGQVHPAYVEAIAISDAELGSLARAGDVQALAGLFERCRPSLYATAIGLLGNRADALDAVQDTFVIALVRLAELRHPGAAGAWLHTVLRNVCLMRIRQRREIPSAAVELPDVPVGTVRSRLNRARARLADALMATVAGTPMSHVSAAAAQRRQWVQFYRVLHERPIPRTYEELFAPEVEVRDPAGHWHGINAWSAEEREAITLGVRAKVMDVLASSDITILEIDFCNPAEWPGHCPPQATFIHRVSDGRTRQLQIHYPAEHSPSD
jgi:RNA polymerase sigma-70 factor, ECF subfamily